MKVFIRVPVDPDNLPEGTVIAFETKKGKEKIVTTELEPMSLDAWNADVTHYLKEVEVPDKIILNHLK